MPNNDNPVCVICSKICDCKYGNSPFPIKKEGRCCSDCNMIAVIPARMRVLGINIKEDEFKLFAKLDKESNKIKALEIGYKIMTQGD